MTDDASQRHGDGIPMYDRVSRFRVSDAVAELATSTVRTALHVDSLSPCSHPGAVLVCGRHQRVFCPSCWTDHWARYHDLLPRCDGCDQPGGDFVYLAVSAGSGPEDQYEVTAVICEPCRGS